MKYSETKEWESERCPDVRVTVRCLSYGRRLALSEQLQRTIEDLEQVTAKMELHPDKENLPPGLLNRANSLVGRIDEAYVRAGFVGCAGLEIEGFPEITAEVLIDHGPHGLVAEIAERVKRLAGLSEDEAKNSSSPATSSGSTIPEDGGSAGSACPPAITSAATAESSSRIASALTTP